MITYYAVVQQERGSSFGIYFPDLPGCFSASDREDEVMAHAQEALALYAADHTELPPARSLLAIRRDREVQADLRDGGFLVAVPLLVTGHKERFNLMLDRSLVASVDHLARATGTSRSEFVATALLQRLQSEAGVAVVPGAKPPQRVRQRIASAKVLKDPKASKEAKPVAASALTQKKK